MALTDTFTDTSGTNLSAHVSDSGHSWTKHASYGGNAIISNLNRLRSSAASNGLYYSSWVPASAEYSVQADVVTVTQSGGGPGVAALIATGANTLYLVFWSGGAGAWRLQKFVAGVNTVLGDYVTNPAAGSTYNIRLEIKAATKKVFLDGVEIISSTDNAITAAGRAGAFVPNNSTTDTTGRHLDNLSAADPLTAYALTAAVGALALTGNPAGLRAARTLAAAAGSLALTGSVAGLRRAATLPAAGGSYGLSGQAASLRAARMAAAGAGGFTLTGEAAGLRATRTLSVVAAGFVLSGQPTGLLAMRRFTAGRGQVDLSGQDAALSVAGAGSQILTAAPGSFGVTGLDTSLRASRVLGAVTGDYVFSGNPAQLHRGYLLGAEAGTVELTGAAATVRTARQLAAAFGTYVLDGRAAGLAVSNPGGGPICYGGSVTVRTAYGGRVTVRVKYGGTATIRTRYGGTARICSDE